LDAPDGCNLHCRQLVEWPAHHETTTGVYEIRVFIVSWFIWMGSSAKSINLADEKRSRTLAIGVRVQQSTCRRVRGARSMETIGDYLLPFEGIKPFFKRL
jgi:hypothetical protein